MKLGTLDPDEPAKPLLPSARMISDTAGVLFIAEMLSQCNPLYP